MKIIKLTLLNDDELYINTAQIGALQVFPEIKEYGEGIRPKCTNVGVTTHRNGGYLVKETPSRIMDLILQAPEL